MVAAMILFILAGGCAVYIGCTAFDDSVSEPHHQGKTVFLFANFISSLYGVGDSDYWRHHESCMWHLKCSFTPRPTPRHHSLEPSLTDPRIFAHFFKVGPSFLFRFFSLFFFLFCFLLPLTHARWRKHADTRIHMQKHGHTHTQTHIHTHAYARAHAYITRTHTRALFWRFSNFSTKALSKSFFHANSELERAVFLGVFVVEQNATVIQMAFSQCSGRWNTIPQMYQSRQINNVSFLWAACIFEEIVQVRIVLYFARVLLRCSIKIRSHIDSQHWMPT